LSLVTFLLLAVVAAPLGRIGLFAVDAAGGVWPTLRTFLLASIIVGAITALVVPLPVASSADADPERRRTLRRIAVAGVGVPALLAGWYTLDYARFLRHKSSRQPVALGATEA